MSQEEVGSEEGHEDVSHERIKAVQNRIKKAYLEEAKVTPRFREVERCVERYIAGRFIKGTMESRNAEKALSADARLQKLEEVVLADDFKIAQLPGLGFESLKNGVSSPRILEKSARERGNNPGGAGGGRRVIRDHHTHS